jgi:hypothetical protein
VMASHLASNKSITGCQRSRDAQRRWDPRAGFARARGTVARRRSRARRRDASFRVGEHTCTRFNAYPFTYQPNRCASRLAAAALLPLAGKARGTPEKTGAQAGAGSVRSYVSTGAHEQRSQRRGSRALVTLRHPLISRRQFQQTARRRRGSGGGWIHFHRLWTKQITIRRRDHKPT